ncbi:uroporphyrinogen-III synthase [Sphingomonas sp. RS6]
MSRAIAVLRPEPGNRATAAAIEARGRRAIRLPLFEIRALDWRVPDPAGFDALILTSANAVRMAGAGLATLLPLPVHAVGAATAAAARRAGFSVVAVGEAGAADLVARAEAGGVRRALHLAGRDRTIEAGGAVASVIAVYANEAVAVDAAAAAMLNGCVALVQSSRAGARLAEIAPQHETIAVVAISEAARAAAGPGWARSIAAPTPDTDALIDIAIALAD